MRERKSTLRNIGKLSSIQGELLVSKASSKYEYSCKVSGRPKRVLSRIRTSIQKRIKLRERSIYVYVYVKQKLRKH